MEYEKIKEWLDKQVRNVKEGNELEYFNSQIKACGPGDRIHIYKGINIIADTMGIKLNVEEDRDLEYPFRYSFVYEGIEFSQIETRELIKDVSV